MLRQQCAPNSGSITRYTCGQVGLRCETLAEANLDSSQPYLGLLGDRSLVGCGMHVYVRTCPAHPGLQMKELGRHRSGVRWYSTLSSRKNTRFWYHATHIYRYGFTLDHAFPCPLQGWPLPGPDYNVEQSRQQACLESAKNLLTPEGRKVGRHLYFFASTESKN